MDTIGHDVRPGWPRTVTVAFALAVLAIIASIASSPANAYRFQFDDPDIVFYIDTTLTASAAMRTESPKQPGTQPTGKFTVFESAGDVYSSPVSALMDIGLSKGNYGVFTRLSYIYDYTIMKSDCSNCRRPTAALGLGFPNPDGIATDAQKEAGRNFSILDLFVYGGWYIGDRPLNVRVGKQVISWGESNISGGGISQMQNPTDLGKRTTPGTEVKETLLPQESVYFNFGLTDNVELEGYYTWNWRNSVFLQVGTLFSPFDFIGTGYNPDLFVPGIEFSGREEPSGGQWGVGLHFILERFNAAELGIYYTRSHAFSPFISRNPDYVPRPDPARPGFNTLAGYQWEYGEDQDTYAISLSGETILDASFGLELNLKTDFYDTRQCQNSFGIGSFFGIPGAGGNGTKGVTPGCDIGNSDMYTFLGNFTRSTGTTLLNADKLSLVFDWSAVWITDLDKGDPTDRLQSKKFKPLNRVDVGNFYGVDALDRPLTEFSWGYNFVAGLEYNDVFANVNVLPTLIFSHAVEGYTPFQAGALVENTRTIVAKVGFTYLTRTQVDVQWVHWIGSASTSDDADNLSIVFKYSF